MRASDAVEFLTGWKPFDLWRCQHDDGALTCERIAEVDVGSKGEFQLCDEHAADDRYRRFRVRYRLMHSDELRKEFEADRSARAEIQ